MVRAATAGINDFLKQEWLHPVAHPVFEEAGLKVEILRLDRIHPLVSGNKWLKLQDWFQQYYRGNYRGILTAGGPWSNHLHACAYACLLSRVPMEALVKGHSAMQNAMLNDLKAWNVTVRFVNRDLFYNRQAWSLYAEQQNLLFIPMGGDGPEGVAGVTDWMNQLPLGTYHEIFCPVGTATTLQGIALSNLNFNRLTGTDPGTGDKSLQSKIEQLNRVLLHKNARLLSLGNRMGKPTSELVRFMQQWQKITAIEPDMVYTGPMFKLFTELAAANEFARGSRILLIHTGGLQGNRSLAYPV